MFFFYTLVGAIVSHPRVNVFILMHLHAFDE